MEIGDNIPQKVVDQATSGIYWCYLCDTELDSNHCCTNEECPLYGIPQG